MYLSRCLDSLRVQTLKDIEVLCINDGSSDSSLKILETLSKKDRRFKVISQDNSGPAAARNKGLENANGKYIMFCDSDDWYEPDMCEIMYNSIDKSDADIAMCKCKFVFDKEIKKQEQIEHRRLNERYYNWDFSGVHIINPDMQIRINPLLWNKIWKNEIIKKFNIKFPTGHEHDDDAFWYMYSFVSNRIMFVERVLYNYCIRSGSIMDNYFLAKPKNREDRLNIALFVLDWLKKLDILKENIIQFYRIFDTQIKNMAIFFERKDIINLLKQVKAERTEFKDKLFVISRSGKIHLFLNKAKLKHYRRKYLFYLCMYKITRLSFYLEKAEKAKDIVQGEVF